MKITDKFSFQRRQESSVFKVLNAGVTRSFWSRIAANQPSTLNRSFVANAINSTANNLRNTPALMR